MLTVMLIDDEEDASELLEILLLEIGGVSVEGKFQVVSEAIERAEVLQPDIVFLDIEMPGMSGLEAGEHLAARCPNTEIIYVTAYHDYAVEAFETNAIGYLLKPVGKEKLVKALGMYTFRQERAAKRFGSEPQAAAAAEADGSTHSASKLLHLKVLGSLELYGTDGRLMKWRTKKTKELFAYLWCHAGSPVYRYHILEHLWSNIDAERAQTLFHTTLYNLRNMLRTEGFPDVVAFVDERYWMNAEAVRSDVDRLEAVMQEAESTNTPGELLSLYRGDFLETEHYQWADRRRMELRLAYCGYLKRLLRTAAEIEKEQISRALAELEFYQE